MTRVDLKSKPILAGYVRQKMDPVSGEPLLLFPEGVLFLNATSQCIVELCQGKLSGEEIVSSLSLEYEVDEATLRSDIEECLTDLTDRNLITWQQ